MKRLLIISLFLLAGVITQAQVPTDTTSLRSMINSVLVANGSKQITAKQMNEILNGIVSLMKAHAVDDAYKSGDTIYLTRSGGYPAIKLYVPGSGSISESDPTVPTAAKLLTNSDISRWNNKQDKLTEGTGVDITANVITANNSVAIWNAEKIQGRLIDPTIPTVGQVLKWNGTAWIPQDDLGGSGTVTATAPLDNTAGNLTLAYDPTTLKVEGGVLKGTDTSSISNRINAVNDSITALHQRIDTTAGGSTELDNVLFAGTGSPESPYAPKTFTVGSIAELKTYNGQFKYYAVVEGQISAGDFGKRSFRWDASSTATPDDVTIVQVPGVTTGRWIHIPVDNTYNVAWWGLNTVDIGALLNTVVAAVPAGSIVKIPQQNGKIFTLATTINLTKAIDIDFGNARIERNGTTGNYVSVSANNVTIRNGWFRGQPTDTVYTGGQVNNFISVVGADAANPILNFKSYGIRTSMGKNSSFWLRYVKKWEIIDCQSDTMPYAGIMALSAPNGLAKRFIGTQFRGVYVFSGVAPNIDTSINAYGVAISKGSLPGDYNSDSCIIEDSYFDWNPYWEMIDTHGADFLTVRRNTIRRAMKGIAIVYYGGDASRHFSIDDNTIDNSGLIDNEHGIQIQGENTVTFASGTITRNRVIGANIGLSNTRAVDIRSNTVAHPSTGSGVYLRFNNFDFTIDGLAASDIWDQSGGGNNAVIKTAGVSNFGKVMNTTLDTGRFVPPAGFETWMNRYGIRPNNNDITNRIVVYQSTNNFKKAKTAQYANTGSLIFQQNTGRRRQTGDFTVLPEDYEIGYEHATGGLHTATLPAADSLFHYRRFIITNTSPGTLATSGPYYTVFGGAAQNSIPARTSVEFLIDSAYNILFARTFPMDPPPAGGGGDSLTYVTHTRLANQLDSFKTATAIAFSSNFVDNAGVVDLAYPIPAPGASGTVLKSNGIAWIVGTDETGSGGTGITGLNGQTNSTQSFAVGTSGTDFNISSTGGVHTFNVPDASATSRGLMTALAQTFAGTKNFAGITGTTLSISATSQDNANLGVYASGGNQQTSANFKMGGSTNNVFTRMVMRGSSSTGLAANTSYGGFSIGLMTVLEATTGHHDYISSVNIQAPNITAGAATLGFSSALTLGVNTAPITTLGNWSLFAYGPGRFSALTGANLGSGVAITDAAGGITSEPSLSLTRGGTGATTAAGARANILPAGTAAGQILSWNGSDWVASNANGQFVIAEATTTSTTPFEIASIGVTSGTSGYVEVRLIAQNIVSTTETKYYVQTFTVPYSKTQSGTLTIYSHIANTGSSTAGYTPGFTTIVNTGGVRLRVNSAATETTNWKVYYRVFDGDPSL